MTTTAMLMKFVSKYLDRLTNENILNNSDAESLRQQIKHLSFMVSIGINRTLEDVELLIENQRTIMDDIDCGFITWKNADYFNDWEMKVLKQLNKVEKVKVEPDDESFYTGWMDGGMEDLDQKTDPDDSDFVCIDIVGQKKKSKPPRINVVKKEKKYKPRPQMKCDSCEFETRKKKDFERHLFEFHERTMCTECGLADFVDFKKYWAHCLSHRHNFRCNVCPEEFVDNKSLVKHKRRMHPVPKAPKVCPICGSSVMALKTHIRLVHEKSDQIECPHGCGTYYSNKSLEQHMKYVHTEANAVNCPWCGRFTKNLKRHLKDNQCNIPENERILKPTSTCDVCGKEFKSKEILKRHMERLHGNGEDHKCHLCEFKTKHLGNLNVHLKKVHERRQLRENCPKCGKACIALDWHMKTYHGGAVA